jgi:hypothetical protein
MCSDGGGFVLPTHRLLPATEAFGTAQSIAGTRAGGHPVRADVWVAPLFPVVSSWCGHSDAGFSARARLMDGYPASLASMSLQKDPVGP